MTRRSPADRVRGLCALFATVLLACGGLLYAAETPGQTPAREILQTTGVRGGLIVHVGCGDGKLTAGLCANDSYLVHGLDTAPGIVETARKHIRSLGMYGRVSVDRLDGNRLPYVDNLVNLVVSEDPGEIPMDEVLRVLAPNGVAYIKQHGRWAKTTKPWPAEIDQWTHFLHDATGNAVANDTRAGPPRHMQWTAQPTWCRNHHKLASISAVVSAGGRIFYIVDQGPPASLDVPSRWFVVARDAFNGVLLWKRPIRSWAWHLHGFRSGPVQLPRTLVAEADRVYVPLGIDGPVTALDAATGRIVRTYKETKCAEELIFDGGMLLFVVGSPAAEQAAIDPQRRGEARFPNEKSIVALAARTGEVVWKWSKPETGGPVPLTLATEGRRVFFAVEKDVLCLDRKTGEQLWCWSPAGPDRPDPKATRQPKRGPKQKAARKRRFKSRSVGWSLATLVAHDDVVLWADGKRLSAISAETGKSQWNCECQPGFRSPADVFVAAGLVWLGPEFSEGRDLATGQIKKKNTAVQDTWTVGHHHRCYREKATQRYILTGKRGVEFLDLVSGDHSRNNWVRGTCQYGVMPSGGLIYAPSHACGCFMEAKLYGFWALAPARPLQDPDSRSTDQRAKPDDRLRRGPAYPHTIHHSSPIIHNASFKTHHSSDWPMHRHDPLRSGSTTTEVPTPLRDLWQTDVGGRLSAPVVAEGAVVVSSIDTHRVVVLDARNGKPRWSFTAGGRVDSAPTIHRGLVLFGCADGWVYALRLCDGREAWRFRAAPHNLKTVALDRVESVWPVHGSVLVLDDVAYLAAGRSSYLDGGIHLFGLDPVTGKIVCQSRLRTSHPKASDVADAKKPETETKIIVQNATDHKTFTSPDKSDAFSMDGATTDILLSDGTSVYMRHLRFDRESLKRQDYGRHLFSTSRLLDDAEVHRSHWVLGTGDFRRIPVAYSWIANSLKGGWGSRLAVPYGLLLAFDPHTVWGARRNWGRGYQLFSAENRPFSPDEQPLPDFRPSDGKTLPSWKWSVGLGMRPRSLVRAGKTLFLGGMPVSENRAELSASYNGQKGGLLWALSASDGSKTAEHNLHAPPLWDGMAVAAGRLYIATLDGKMLCLGSKE